MPKCKNDSKRSYKGTEPSPKGLGYCAHAEKLGKKKKGRDGNIWIVKKTIHGVKRWVKFKLDNKKLNKVNHPGFKKYFIHDNGGRPFLVYVKGKKVFIYKNNKYTKLVKKYIVKKVFIGRSSGPPYADHSKKDAKHFVGNTILLKLSKNKYVYIGGTIYEFIINDSIYRYFSLIGRNDVPYPVLLGTDNVYFMLDKKYVSRDMFSKNMKVKDWENAYTYFYWWDVKKEEFDYKTGKKINSLENVAKKIKNVKVIQKRL